MKWHRLNLMPHRMWVRQAHRRRVVREVWWAAGVVLLLVGAAWGLLMVQRQAQQTLTVEYRRRLAQAQSVALQHQQAKRLMAQIQSQRQAAWHRGRIDRAIACDACAHWQSSFGNRIR